MYDHELILACSITGSDRARTARSSTFHEELCWIVNEAEGATRKTTLRQISPRVRTVRGVPGDAGLEIPDIWISAVERLLAVQHSRGLDKMRVMLEESKRFEW